MSPAPSHHRSAPTLSKYSVRKASKPLSTPPLARLELWHGFAVTVAYPPIVDVVQDSQATQSATSKNRLRAELVSKLHFIFFLCIGFGWLCPGHNPALKCTSFIWRHGFKTGVSSLSEGKISKWNSEAKAKNDSERLKVKWRITCTARRAWTGNNWRKWTLDDKHGCVQMIVSESGHRAGEGASWKMFFPSIDLQGKQKTPASC